MLTDTHTPHHTHTLTLTHTHTHDCNEIAIGVSCYILHRLPSVTVSVPGVCWRTEEPRHSDHQHERTFFPLPLPALRYRHRVQSNHQHSFFRWAWKSLNIQMAVSERNISVRVKLAGQQQFITTHVVICLLAFFHGHCILPPNVSTDQKLRKSDFMPVVICSCISCLFLAWERCFCWNFARFLLSN